jgi:hypothetical protein
VWRNPPGTPRFPYVPPPCHRAEDQRPSPCLARAGPPIDPGELDRLLGSYPGRRIGLVPAARPADVLPLMGWPGGANHFADAVPIAAAVRSWEDRSGARVLEVGFADLSLLAYRPPRIAEEAQRIAAEHWAFADECGTGLTDIPAITAQLLSSPVWRFWWD